MKIFFPLLLIVQLTPTLLALQPSVSVNCTYAMASGWYILDDLYTCEVDSLSSPITEAHTIITAVNGQHLEGKNGHDVRAFRIKNSTVNFMPKGLQKFFPNLVAISILSSKLDEIRQSDLAPFPQLKYLNLYNNNLKSIREDLFEFNRKLELIGLHYNEVKYIDVRAIQKLNNLRYLWLIEVAEERV